MTIHINTQSISVAMATYNGSKYIVEQLESIYAQSLKVDEVMIFDDRSTDNTVELIQSFIKSHELTSWKITINQTQLGFSDNFWTAIKACTGSVIFLSDQDDVWYSNKVELMMAEMDKDNSINMVASSHDICNADGALIDTEILYGRTITNGAIENIEIVDLIGRSPVRGCSMCFKSEILKNETLPSLSNGLGHDWFISCIAAMKGRAVFLNKSLFKYRVHTTNTSSQRTKRTRAGLRKITDKRIKYTQEEQAALNLLIKNKNIHENVRQALLQQYVFSSRRNKLMQNLNLIEIFPLAMSINKYTFIYHQNFFGGAKLFIGDILYSFINKFIPYKKDRR